MAAKRLLRGLVGPLTDARHLHRVRIADDTDSNARMPRGVPRNPHHQKQMRAPTPAPRPAAAAAGKFNSATTLLRNSEVCSRLQRPVNGRLGFAKLAMGEPIEFPRRRSGAATLRSSAAVLVCAEINEAQGLRLGLYGPRDGGRGWVWWWGEFKNKIHAGRRIGDKAACTSGVPGSNPPGQRKAALVEGKLRVQFQGGSSS